MSDSTQPDTKVSPLAFGPFVLEVGNVRLTRDGTPVELRPKAFELLAALASRPGQLVTKDELLDSVWGRRFITEGVIKSLVSELRVALDDDPKAPRWIETVARRGYRFCGTLRPLGGAARVDGPALPVDAAPATPPLLLGRQSTWQTLQTAWQRAVAGQRAAVLIGGDAGVGKSTLAAALAASVPTHALAHGACVEGYGQSEPYGPWLQALAALAAQDPALPTLLRQVAPNWLAQLPWLQDETDAGRGTAPERMPREMAVLLERLSAQRPLLVWLEDLHWADHASVQLLDLLVRQRSAARVLLLGTVRTLDAAIAGHPMADARREWRLHGLVQDLVLTGLDEAGVAALAATRHPGAEWPASAVQALQRHTEGLPLFVVAVLDALAEGGVLAEAEPGRWQLQGALPQPLPLPDSVGGLFEKQLAALAPAQRELLEAAAVAGLEFDAGVLAEALDADAGEVHARCDGLVRGGRWLRAVGVSAPAGAAASARYRFGHALMQGVCHARCGAARRIELHRGVAAALAARDGADGEGAAARAWHLEQALDFDAAIVQLDRAARRAQLRAAPREQLTIAEHAMSLLPRCRDAALRETAALQAEIDRMAAVGNLYGYTAPIFAEAARRAIERHGPRPPDAVLLTALRGLWLYGVLSGHHDDALALAEQAVARVQSVEDAPLRVQALSMQAFSAFKCGAFATARTALAASANELARCTPAADALHRFIDDLRVEHRIVAALMEALAGEPAPAAEGRMLREAVAGHWLPMSRALNGVLVGLWLAWRGDAEAVAELAQQSLALIAREELSGVDAPYRLLGAWAQGASGDTQASCAALPLLRAALADMVVGGRQAELAAFHELEADLAQRAGLADEAAAALDAAFAHIERTGERYVLGRLEQRRKQLAALRG